MSVALDKKAQNSSPESNSETEQHQTPTQDTTSALKSEQLSTNTIDRATVLEQLQHSESVMPFGTPSTDPKTLTSEPETSPTGEGQHFATELGEIRRLLFPLLRSPGENRIIEQTLRDRIESIPEPIRRQLVQRLQGDDNA